MSKDIDYKERNKFYELECNETVDYEFVLSMITDKVNTILEIPCGIGRLTYEIAKKHRKLVAADLEPEMIDTMKEGLKDHPLKSYIDPRIADMTNFSFDERFDLIVIPREAFQLLKGSESAIKALKCMKRHLSPQGIIVVDLFTFQQVSKNNLKTPEHIADLPDYYDYDQPDGVMVFDWTKELGPNETLSRLRCQHHLEDGIVQIIYNFKKQNITGTLDDMKMIIELQNYCVDTFSAICADTELDIKNIYGDYSKKTYESKDPRMIFVLG